MPFGKRWSPPPARGARTSGALPQLRLRPIRPIAPKRRRRSSSWSRSVTRGEIYRLRGDRRARGHEQAGARFALVLQDDDLSALSTVMIAPTSASAPPRPFRPEIEVRGRRTRVLLEQLRSVDRSRLGDLVGSVSRREVERVDDALRKVVGLVA